MEKRNFMKTGRRRIGILTAGMMILSLGSGIGGIPVYAMSENGETETVQTTETVQSTEEVTTPVLASNPVVLDVDVQGKSFSTVADADAAPYYKALRFTPSATQGGSYTFYSANLSNNSVPSYSYISTENYYQGICNNIETEKRIVSASPPDILSTVDYISPSRTVYTTYNLEPGTAYYFISSRLEQYYSGEYLVYLARNIDITLNNESATSPGTDAIYSMGDLWVLNAERYGDPVDKITPPEKTGYTFKGYYSQSNGQGEYVIAEDGTFTTCINDFNQNTQLYAYWVPNIFQIMLNQDGATVPGTETLFYKEGKWYLSDEPSAQAVTSITVPQKTGYDFKGYFNDRDGKGKLIIAADGSFTDAAILSNIGDSIIAYWVPAENPAPNPGNNPTPTPTPTPTPEGSVTGSVDNGNTSLQVSLDNETNDLRDKVLTDEQKKRIANGENGRIYLKITDVKDSVSKEDKEQVKDSLNGYSIGQYLDLSLWAQIGSDPEQKITNTNGSIRITIDIPKNLLPKKSDSGRSYRIIRVHDGKASVLKCSYDEKNQKITFETDRFSTYTLVYKDKTSKESAENTASAPAQPVAAAVTTISAKDDVPKTGDQDFSWIYLIGMVCFSGGTVFFGSRAYKRMK